MILVSSSRPRPTSTKASYLVNHLFEGAPRVFSSTIQLKHKGVRYWPDLVSKKPVCSGPLNETPAAIRVTLISFDHESRSLLSAFMVKKKYLK